MNVVWKNIFSFSLSFPYVCAFCVAWYCIKIRFKLPQAFVATQFRDMLFVLFYPKLTNIRNFLEIQRNFKKKNTETEKNKNSYLKQMISNHKIFGNFFVLKKWILNSQQKSRKCIQFHGNLNVYFILCLLIHFDKFIAFWNLYIAILNIF